MATLVPICISMGSAAAGKFQDHYKILGIDSKASADIVQMAYNALFALYDTAKGSEPNQEKLGEINLALEVLLDPVSRKMFDAVRGGEDEREVIFSGMAFFEALPLERDRRMTMLCVLYDVRRQNPRVPLVTMRQFEKVVQMTEDQIQLCLWYLKNLGWISVDDKSKMQITASGMDYLENNSPDPRRIWPFLKNPAGPEPDTADLSSLNSAFSSLATPQVPEPVSPQTLPAPSAEIKPKTISLIRRTSIAITEA